MRKKIPTFNFGGVESWTKDSMRLLLVTQKWRFCYCVGNSCSDLATKEEIDDLKATFEDRFNYHAEIKYLDVTKKLQVRVNAIVATFVEQHDSPNTLLIVYYAGHGRPGPEYGSLELFGSVCHELRFTLSLIVADKLHQTTSKSA